VVNTDETNFFFDMESRLTLANKGDKTVSLKTTGTSIWCTMLLGVTLNGEKLTPLVVFKGQPNGRIARTFNMMPVSMKYVCQAKAWVDQRVFKHCIAVVWRPFTVERTDKIYLLMDEFSVHLMATCCDVIKECGSEVDYILGDYSSNVQVMDVGVNKPLKSYVREAYENFMIGNPENRKVRREDIVQWIQTGWEKVKVETITRTWNKAGINVQDVAIV
jgi:DDE superfamily endonuclease